MNEVCRHLSDDIIIQLPRQLGTKDTNQVKRASQGISELLLNAISKNATHPEMGNGLFGALKKDHDGDILGDLLGVRSGNKQVNNVKNHEWQ